MGKSSVLVGLTSLFALSLAALAQTTATLTGVTQVSNATTALRLLQCYRETATALVVCDVQITNTQPDQPLALNLSVAQVLALAGAKTIPASSLKAQEARTATQSVSLIIDPRSSKRLSASFTVPQTVSSLSALRVGGFQFTDAVIAKTKPSAALSSVQVLDASQLNFAIGSYQFTFKGFSLVDNNALFANFDVISNSSKEEPLGAKNIDMRLFDSTGAQITSQYFQWSTRQRDISVPPGVIFQLQIGFTGGDRTAYQRISSTITKYLELTVNGETRTFQNVDLRPLAR